MITLTKTYLLVGLSLLMLNTSAFASPKASHKKANQADKMLQLAYKQLVKKPSKKVKPLTKQAKVASRRIRQSRYRAAEIAKKQLRKKYRWGGTSPRTGFDCSGLMQYAYKSAKIHLPRTASAQYKHTKRIAMSKLQVGDLIFFRTSRTRQRVNHVGIYLGGGKFIHAPRKGKRVSVANLNRYWRRKAIGAGRV